MPSCAVYIYDVHYQFQPFRFHFGARGNREETENIQGELKWMLMFIDVDATRISLKAH